MAQCHFFFIPNAPYYCVGTTTIYAIQDTAHASHTANWTIVTPPGDSPAVAPLVHNMRYSFILSVPGTYIVTMLDTVAGQVCTYTDSLHVYANPTVRGAISETGHLCLPTTACWIDSSHSPNSTSLSYNFDWGNGIVDTSFCKPYDTPGVYSLLLTVTDTLGCYSMYSNQNIFHVGGAVMGMSAGVTGACVCDTVSFIVTSWDANVLTWISGGGSPDTIFNDTIVRGTQANPTFTTFKAQYCNAGTIRPIVIGMDSASACAVIDTMPLQVIIDPPLTQPSITVNGYTLSANTAATTNVHYTWALNGIDIATDTNTITASQNGSYTLQISNACNSILSDSVSIIGLGIADIGNSTGIIIYPNPAAQSTNITISSSLSETYNADLIDMTGKKIAPLFTGKKIDTHSFSFAASAYAKGIYLLQLTDSDGQITVRKIVIE